MTVAPFDLPVLLLLFALPSRPVPSGRIVAAAYSPRDRTTAAAAAASSSFAFSSDIVAATACRAPFDLQLLWLPVALSSRPVPPRYSSVLPATTFDLLFRIKSIYCCNWQLEEFLTH